MNHSGRRKKVEYIVHMHVAGSTKIVNKLYMLHSIANRFFSFFLKSLCIMNVCVDGCIRICLYILLLCIGQEKEKKLCFLLPIDSLHLLFFMLVCTRKHVLLTFALLAKKNFGIFFLISHGTY